MTQGELFNGDQFNVAPPPRAEGHPVVNAAERYIASGRTGEQGLLDRQGRKLVNMARIAMNVQKEGQSSKTTPARRTGGSKDRDDIGLVGLEVDARYWQHSTTKGTGRGWLPGVHHEHEWRKFGTTEEVPYTRIVAGQSYFTAERVDELIDKPGTGQDPRFTGHLRELPRGVRTVSDEVVMQQGHHRVLRDMWKDQPEMFHQMRTVPEPTSNRESYERRREVQGYRAERSARVSRAKRMAAEKRPPPERAEYERERISDYDFDDYDSDDYDSESWSEEEQPRRRGPAVLRDSDQFGTWDDDSQ